MIWCCVKGHVVFWDMLLWFALQGHCTLSCGFLTPMWEIFDEKNHHYIFGFSATQHTGHVCQFSRTPCQHTSLLSNRHLHLSSHCPSIASLLYALYHTSCMQGVWIFVFFPPYIHSHAHERINKASLFLIYTARLVQSLAVVHTQPVHQMCLIL